jgi:hypothetical protein
MKYTLTSAALSTHAQTVIRADGASIPPDPENADYQAFLDWMAAGNTPPPSAEAPGAPVQASRRQFFQAAAQQGVITQDEAVALLAAGAIPASLSAAISSLPTAQQFPARMALLGDQTFTRSNRLVVALGVALGKTDADLDALFTNAATL